MKQVFAGPVNSPPIRVAVILRAMKPCTRSVNRTPNIASRRTSQNGAGCQTEEMRQEVGSALRRAGRPSPARQLHSACNLIGIEAAFQSHPDREVLMQRTD